MPRSSKFSLSLRFLPNAPLLCTIRATCSIHFILSYFIWRRIEILKPPYVICSTPELPHPFKVQMSSSASYPRTPAPYVLKSMWQTKIHTHTNNKENCSFVYLKIYIFWNWKTKDRMTGSIPWLPSTVLKLIKFRDFFFHLWVKSYNTTFDEISVSVLVAGI